MECNNVVVACECFGIVGIDADTIVKRLVMEVIEKDSNLLCVCGDVFKSDAGWDFFGNDRPLLFGVGKFNDGYIRQRYIHKIQR